MPLHLFLDPLVQILSTQGYLHQQYHLLLQDPMLQPLEMGRYRYQSTNLQYQDHHQRLDRISLQTKDKDRGKEMSSVLLSRLCNG